MSKLFKFAGFFAVLATGCAIGAEESSEESVGSVDQAIKSGINVPTNDRLALSTVMVLTPTGSCTGTIVGPHHIITAAHCGPVSRATQVVFYRGSLPDFATTTNVGNVYMKPGVTATDTIDDAGKFADIAVLQIEKDIGAIHAALTPARFPSAYPGPVGGLQVGRGAHDGAGNPNNLLRFRTNTFWSPSFEDGGFSTESDGTDPGDSGGPIYTTAADGALIVHGALWGYVWDWFGYRNRYTSTAFHIQSILTASGNVFKDHWNYWGNDLGPGIPNSSRTACALACMQMDTCNAWTFDTPSGTCWRKSTRGTGGFGQSGLSSGFKTQTTVVRQNWNYPGNDFPPYTDINELGCQNVCLGRTDCNAWTFVPNPGSSLGTCWAKSGIGSGGSPLQGVKSGVKTTTQPCRTPGSPVCTI